MHSPLVSIGVPVYNGASLLDEALRSALAQDYSPIEILVSDNDSTDDTATILERFAADDSRVRVMRQDRNLGPIVNFRRVLEEARGTYFTWLAHDDVLTNPSYLSAAVSYLEAHPDVAACCGRFRMFDPAAGSDVVLSLEELGPEQMWRHVRRELFRWPPSDRTPYAIYGCFRRDSLAAAEARVASRSTDAMLDIPTLAAIATRGRIVALPIEDRAFRLRNDSEGRRMMQVLSPFQLLKGSFVYKWILLRLAWGAPLPLGERLGLLSIAAQNLVRVSVRHPWGRAQDYALLIKAQIREREVLRNAVRARTALIASLEPETGERSEHFDRLEILESGSWRDPRVGWLSGFLRPPPSHLDERYQTLLTEVEILRRHCAELLEAIERLDAQAQNHHDPALK